MKRPICEAGYTVNREPDGLNAVRLPIHRSDEERRHKHGQRIPSERHE